MDTTGRGGAKQYRHSLGWNLGFSSYWFASSYKWFILLFILLPAMVSKIVPGGEKSREWGLIFAVGSLWSIFGTPIAGRLNETLHGIWRLRHVWILLGSVVTVAGLALVYLSKGLLSLAVAYFVLQMGDNIGTGPYAGMIPDVVPEQHRGYSSSILGGLKSLGQIASAIGALILKKPELILFGVGAVNILCALWTSWIIRDLPPPQESKRPRKGFVHDWIEPFKDHDFLFVWLNRFVCALAFAIIAGYALFFLQDMFTSWKLGPLDFKDAKTAAQVVALTISFFGVVGAVVSARISDRTGRKPLLVVSGLVMAACLVPAAFIHEFTLTWCCIVVLGLGIGVYGAADWALVGDILPNPDKAATEMGIWHAAETVVQLVGGLTGAAITWLNAVRFGLGYESMLVASAVLYIASTFLVRGIKGSR